MYTRYLWNIFNLDSMTTLTQEHEIWKFNLSSTVEMPIGAQILSVQFQNNALTIWAICNINAGKENRFFETLGTGWKAVSLTEGEKKVHLSTVQDGGFVWHIFEIVKS